MSSTFVATPTHAVLACLLPDRTTLCLAACHVDTPAAQITLVVRSIQTAALCPLCTTPARRIHSRYERTLADLPQAEYRVRLRLRVRKCFCRNPHCHRCIFTRTRTDDRCAVGTAHAAARSTLGHHGPHLGWRGWRMAEPALRPGSQSEHAATPAS